MNGIDRIDKLIANKYNISRSEASLLIKQGKVFLNNNKINKIHTKINIKDLDKININEKDIKNLTYIDKNKNDILKKDINNKIEQETKNIDLTTIYEDEDILVINKPKGLVVYSGVGKENISVSSILSKKYSLSDFNGKERAGIVHRIDKDTSGLLIIAKNNKAHKYYENLFKERKVEKEYIALVRGVIQELKGKIDMPIARSKTDFKKMETIKDGKEAITYFEVINRFKKYTLVKINIETGRTHQIRVHFAKIGYPIVGDKKYSKGKNDFNLDSQLLHASALIFVNTKYKKIKVEVDIPKEFKNILKTIEKNS